MSAAPAFHGCVEGGRRLWCSCYNLYLKFKGKAPYMPSDTVSYRVPGLRR